MVDLFSVMGSNPGGFHFFSNPYVARRGITTPSANQRFGSGSGSGGSSTFWVEAEAEAIFENHLEAEAEAEALVKKKIGSRSGSDLKKNWVEAEAEAIFFPPGSRSGSF